MNYFKTIHAPRRIPKQKLIIVLSLTLLMYVTFIKDSSLPIAKEIKYLHKFLGLNNPVIILSW